MQNVGKKTVNLRRRSFLQAGALLAAGSVMSAPAQDLLPTPAQMPGPFYPREFPLDRDNDLVTVAGRAGRAHGMITRITGRVLDARGRPQTGVRVEIWQVNGYGRYHHAADDSDRPLDPNFQGYGMATTGADGAYGFRTIKPLPYPGRAPHIHFALTGQDFGGFITQMYLAGAPENEHDFLLSRIRERAARSRLVVPLVRSAAANDELAGEFNIVLGEHLERGGLPQAYRHARLGL